MRKAPFIALTLLALWVRPAGAVDIKNVRAVYGPFGGERASNKFLPGDILFLAFDVEDLSMDTASALVQYKIKLEVFDATGNRLFGRESKNQHYLTLGQARVSERGQVVTGTEQKPGKYTVKLTATDVRLKEPKEKSISYSFEILPADFGMIHLSSPAVAVPLQEYTTHVALVGWAKDAKKLPNIEVRLRILDATGKPTLPKPFVTNIPKDLPEEVDLKDRSILPLPFPITINRAGRFTIEIEATDKMASKTSQVRFPLLVLEPSVAVAGK
ncbi:MAG: hypothetical protein IT429_17130 [Gemmataceae bacterium]|nr:hypothetical protein [Gemmataceae bacterium]